MDEKTAPPPARGPSRLWYVGHVFLGVISGLVCYLVWRDQDIKAARRHLVWSMVITIIIGIFWAALIVLAALP